MQNKHVSNTDNSSLNPVLNSTELVFLKDSYLKELKAKVLDITSFDTSPALVLDKTIFYPTGGGQPCDLGFINLNSQALRVVNVVKRSGIVLHVLDPESLGLINDLESLKQSIVTCVIDWDRRYKLMRMHTASHIIAALINKKAGALITGNQLGVDKSRVDFNTEVFDRALFEEVVQEANKIVGAGLDLKIYYLPRMEALKIPGVVKLANKLPPSIETLRIVEIPGVDVQADGGTHVNNTSEVRSIKLLKLENKGKNNRRLYFGLD
ncbi:alanyl-tRNA editing protein [Candidatus Woesearchaeota archaeon]|nr:alanyl-tRNA editing protein [Candidatus Woesearchaeota archaeon]